MDELTVQGPEWPELRRELYALAASCEASVAFVLDTGNILWAAAGRGFGRRHELANVVYEAEVLPRVASLRRGARLDATRCVEGAHYCVRSFASTYVVAVCFDGPFAAAPTKLRVKRALPRIQELVLSLPPLGGPGHDAGAVKVRA